MATAYTPHPIANNMTYAQLLKQCVADIKSAKSIFQDAKNTLQRIILSTPIVMRGRPCINDISEEAASVIDALDASTGYGIFVTDYTAAVVDLAVARHKLVVNTTNISSKEVIVMLRHYLTTNSLRGREGAHNPVTALRGIASAVDYVEYTEARMRNQSIKKRELFDIVAKYDTIVESLISEKNAYNIDPPTAPSNIEYRNAVRTHLFAADKNLPKQMD